MNAYSRYSLVAWLFCCFIGTTKAFAAEHKVVFVTEDLFPLQFQRAGVIQGLSTKLVKEAAERAKLDYEIHLYNWTRAYNLAKKTKNVCIFSIVKIPEREKEFIWIGELIKLKAQLFVHSQREDINIETLQDAKPYGVMAVDKDVVHQYLHGKGFVSGTDIYLASSREHMLGVAVSKKNSPLLLFDQFLFKHWAKQQGIDDTLLKPVLHIKDLDSTHYLACNPETDSNIISGLRNTLSIGFTKSN